MIGTAQMYDMEECKSNNKETSDSDLNAHKCAML